MPERIIIEDGEFLQLIIEGHTSAYTIHTYMKERLETNEKRRIISYKGVTERLLGLAKAGLIEETKIGKPSIHGRKDYRVTPEGMIKLIPYILAHSQEIIAKDEVPVMIEYMDKFDFDKEAFGGLIFWHYIYITTFVNEYLKHIQLHKIISTDSGEFIEEIIPTGFKENVMNELVRRIDEAAAKTKAITKSKSKAKGRKTKTTIPTVIRISADDTQRAADLIDKKALYALLEKKH